MVLKIYWQDFFLQFFFSWVNHYEMVSVVCLNITHLSIVSLWVGGEVI